MKRLLSSWTLLCVLVQLWAQAPAGYYSAASGSKGKELKTALYHIITSHTERTYKELWTDFTQTDVREDGKVWDMYSSTNNFEFISQQCGGTGYRAEGDCYNREHSFPKSWFNEGTPMYTDLFHMYPTDGYVNNRRGNYPFGETKGETYQSHGGHCKLGKSTTSGYSGTVFEPADEYKGDFARTYFYMATSYEDRIANWKSDMLAQNSYPAYTQWAIDMLLRWANEDPVSPKEVARNNAVYSIQHNRNPYIDFPGLEQYVWGSKTNVAFDPDNYEGGNVPPVEKEVEEPTFSPSSGKIQKGGIVTVSTTTPNAYIVYTINDGDQYTEASPIKVEIKEPTTITAYAFLEDKTSEKVTATYTLVSTQPDEGVQTFRKVTSTADLQIGNRYLIVCEGMSTAMGVADNDIRKYSAITVENDKIHTEVNGSGQPYQFILSGTTDAYTLYDATAQSYLALNSNANKLHASAKADSNHALWTITLNKGETTISNKEYTDRSIQYNQSSPRFACYKSGQQPVALYVNTTSGSNISNITTSASTPVNVYTLDGRMVRKDVRADKALEGLNKGLYIIKGNKILVK